MSDKPNGIDKAAPARPDPRQMGYAALGAQINLMIAFGVPVTDVINLVFETVSNLISGVEPAHVREAIIAECRTNLPAVVTRHYQQRHPSGLVLPQS